MLFRSHHDTLERAGFAPFRERYLAAWLHTGQEVDVEGHGTAVVRGLAPNGYLLATLPAEGGREVELHPDGAEERRVGKECTRAGWP